MAYIAIAVCFGIAGGIVGRIKGSSFTLWFLISAVVPIFGLMAAWTELSAFVGAVGASLVLAIVFLVAGLAALGLLRSVLHRSQPASSATKTAT